MSRNPPPSTPFFRRRIVVIGTGFIAMMLAVAVVWLALKWVPEMPVKEVRFTGAFTRVDANELARVAAVIAPTHNNARRSLLRVDLDEVKAAVKEVAWVRNVDIRRQLPGTLVVNIEEHIPYGVWIDVAPASSDTLPVPQLVNNFGEVFKARMSPTADGNSVEMPVFAGPSGTSKEVLRTFDQFRKQLVAIERVPKELRLSNRRAWSMLLDNGVTLELGRNDADARLARFIRAYGELPVLQAANTHVDLRYQNGLALRTPPAVKPDKAKRT
jgi:cell division protein FtsQ